jgi:glycine/D-amino acid oxidase-like deaminating enzyme
MEETEVIIVGQGLSGTWLSWWLYRAGRNFRVIDHPDPESASRRAAGLINPVTGRRMVTTWMIDQLMPFAYGVYQEMGKFLNQTFISEISAVDFFPSVQMLQAFQARFEQDPTYLIPGDDREKYADWFKYDLGWGLIHPCYLVNVDKLLTVWNKWLRINHCLIEEEFSFSKFQETTIGINFSGIRSRYIIFCDGKSSAENPYFSKLPFALNKGEGLFVEIKNIPPDLVFKKGMSLVPHKENIYWLGSSYEWKFDDEKPSQKFKINAENWLNQNLKLPYHIVEHFASIRPATLERRPFVGMHPVYPRVGILNGFGTKGCSLAPYFAKQLADKLKGEGQIDPLVNISRFEKIIRRSK